MFRAGDAASALQALLELHQSGSITVGSAGHERGKDRDTDTGEQAFRLGLFAQVSVASGLPGIREKEKGNVEEMLIYSICSTALASPLPGPKAAKSHTEPQAAITCYSLTGSTPVRSA